MYAHPMHRETRIDVLAEAMRSIGFACVVTPDGPSMHATHVPVVVMREGEQVVIDFHVARANRHWQLAGDGAETLAVFLGPQAYVHPGWYPGKAEHGKVVPTWCYVAIHARGTMERIAHGPALRRHLEELTQRNEAHRSDPWAVGDAPAGHVEKLMRAIVGLRLRATRLEGVYKLNQHRNTADRDGVVAGLGRDDQHDAGLVAGLMKQARDTAPTPK